MPEQDEELEVPEDAAEDLEVPEQAAEDVKAGIYIKDA
jgi:hypothetical protein